MQRRAQVDLLFAQSLPKEWKGLFGGTILSTPLAVKLSRSHSFQILVMGSWATKNFNQYMDYTWEYSS